jgi:hypothetical protein
VEATNNVQRLFNGLGGINGVTLFFNTFLVDIQRVYVGVCESSRVYSCSGRILFMVVGVLCSTYYFALDLALAL